MPTLVLTATSNSGALTEFRSEVELLVRGLHVLKAEMRENQAATRTLATAYAENDAAVKKLEKDNAVLIEELATLNKQTKTQTSANMRLKASYQELHSSLRGVSGALGGLWMTYGSLIPLMAGFISAATFKKGVEESAEFYHQLQFVKAVTQETIPHIAKLSQEILKLGRGNLRGPVELAQGMRVLTKAGLDLSSALQALPSVTALSILGELDMAKATKIATASMNIFGKTAAQMPEIADVIAKSSSIAATEVGEIGNALGYMAGSVSMLHLPLREVSAELAVVAQRGVVGSKAGTALNRAWLNLAAQTPKVKRALEELNVSVFNAKGEFKGAQTVLTELADAMTGYTSEAQNQFIKDIFGVRALKAIRPLLDEVHNRYPEFLDKLGDSAGFAKKGLEDLEDNVQGQWKIAMNNLQTSLITAFSSVRGQYTSLVAEIGRLFSSKEFIQFSRSIFKAFLAVSNTILEFKDSLLTLGKAFLIYKLGSPLIGGVVGGITSIAKALGVAEGAALLGLGPAGWIALLAAGLTGLVLLYQKLNRHKLTADEIFAQGVVDTVSGRLDSIKVKIQALNDEYDRLTGRDPFQTEIQGNRANLARMKASLEQAKVALSNALGNAEDAGFLDKLGQALAPSFSKSDRQFRDAAKTVDNLTIAIRKTEQNLRKLQAAKEEYDIAQKRTEGARANLTGLKGIGVPAGLSATLGTGSKTKYEYVDPSKGYKESLQKAKLSLSDQLKILNTLRTGDLISQDRYSAKKVEMAEALYNNQLSVINEYIQRAKSTRAIGEEDRNKRDNFLQKLRIQKAKLEEKYVFDARIESLKASGEAYKAFKSSILKSTREGNKLDAEIAGERGTSLDGSSDIFANYRAQLKLNDQLRQEELDRLQEKTKITGAMNAASLKVYEAFQKAKAKIKEKYEKKNTLLAEQSKKERVNAALNEYQQLSYLVGISGSKAFQHIKAFKLAKAALDLKSAVMSAYADTPGSTFSKFAAAAEAGLFQLAKMQEIASQQYAGQAHDGLPMVPSTGTYLLEKGERVVKKEDNRQLERFLQGNKSSGYQTASNGQSVTEVVFHQTISVDARGNDNGQNIEGRIRQAVEQGGQKGYQLVLRDIQGRGMIRRSLG